MGLVAERRGRDCARVIFKIGVFAAGTHPYGMIYHLHITCAHGTSYPFLHTSREEITVCVCVCVYTCILLVTLSIDTVLNITDRTRVYVCV